MPSSDGSLCGKTVVNIYKLSLDTIIPINIVFIKQRKKG